MHYHHTPEQYIKEGKAEVTDDDDEVSQASSEDGDKPEQISESHRILLNLLKDKDKEIGDLREDIGRLKARIEELEQVSRVHTTPISTAKVEMTSPPVLQDS